MIKHYLTSTFRHLKRNKAYTFINVLGLALGILCATIIFLKVRHELSFDTHHADKDRIYRVVHEDNDYGEFERDAGVQRPLPRAVKADFPGIEHITIVDQNFSDRLVKFKRADGSLDVFEEDNDLAYVNPDFLDIFHYDWIEGNPESALNGPHQAVILESLAKKYFGDESPIGKTFTLDSEKQEYTITGWVKDPTQNTDFPFNMLMTYYHPEEDKNDNNWGSISSSVQCYLKLTPEQSVDDINPLFHKMLVKYRDEKHAAKVHMWAQPLAEVHFDTQSMNFGGSPVSKETIYALIAIGIFIILTACINFINLSTSLVFKRSKEVAMRKVLGSRSGQILAYFLGETFWVTLIASVLALVATPLILSQFEELIGADLGLSLLTDGWLWVFLLGMLLSISLLSGLYPAWLLSRLAPALALKNQFDKGYGKGQKLRKGLIVMQFAISQILIICSLVMIRQMDHFHSVPLGFDKTAIMEMDIYDNDDEQLALFKERVSQFSFVKNVSYSNTGAANSNVWGGNYTYKSEDEKTFEGHAHIKFVDEDFFDTYRLEFVAGEGLIKSDTVNRFVINESMARAFGFENPADAVGKFFTFWSYQVPITGVVKDYTTTSLHKAIEPTVMVYENRYYTCAIKLGGGTVDEAVEKIGGVWGELFRERAFDYAFLEDRLEKFYEDEQRAVSLFQMFAAVAILIGCLGLFGLVSFMAARRTKEIGIRKVLGATVGNILQIFTKEFGWLVVLGFALSGPLAWYVMRDWLEGFEYRIELGVWIFVIAILVSFLIAGLTVGYRSWLAATANPIESLRDE